MIRKNIKTALRYFWRDKLYSAIGIIGLSLGMASCLICYLHVRFEKSYDQYHPDKARIFRLVKGDPQEGEFWAGMAAPVPVLLEREFPEVEEYARLADFSWDPKAWVKYQDKSFYEEYFMLADPAFFAIFDYHFIHGDKATALDAPGKVVLTERIAQKYFGDRNPVGEALKVDSKYDFTVSAVVENPPANSHLTFNFLVPFENLDRVYFKGASQQWRAFNYAAYVRLTEQAKQEELQQKISSYKLTLDKEKEITLEDNVMLQKLTDIHFQHSRGNQKAAYDKKYIYIFIAAAIAVLLIAAINYITLSTARSQSRIRETGVRKSMGANRSQLIVQYITESVLTALFALMVSLLLLHAALPKLNQLLESQMQIPYGDPFFLLSLGIVALLIGVLSGLYIAIYITSFSPVKALKGKIRVNTGGLGFRKILLVMQFAVSSALIISAFVILKQMRLVTTKDIGLRKDKVITISVFGEEGQSKIPLFKKEVAKIPGVKSVAASSFVPGKANYNQTVWWEGQEKPVSLFLIPCDQDFIETLGIAIVEGDMAAIRSNTEADYCYVLNESARDFIGWDQAYGKLFSAYGKDRAKMVSAVVKDFNYQSLHHGIEPLAFVVSSKRLNDRVVIQLESKNFQAMLGDIREAFQETIPGLPFEYSFMEDNFAKLYKTEEKAGKIISFLGILSVLIALFGVFGLASFSIKERTKEIAIRKVMGINARELVQMLSRDFILLILPGILLAWPVSWYLMTKWLENFSYKTSLGISVFMGTGLAVLIVVLLTISAKAVSAAKMNPAEELRYE